MTGAGTAILQYWIYFPRNDCEKKPNFTFSGRICNESFPYNPPDLLLQTLVPVMVLNTLKVVLRQKLRSKNSGEKKTIYFEILLRSLKTKISNFFFLLLLSNFLKFTIKKEKSSKFIYYTLKRR
jgi:hypothetical protein